MKIYTKTGDTGTTSLVGGTRIPKSCDRLEAYGTIDELNAIIGVALEELKSLSLDVASNADRVEMAKTLLTIQNNLFTVGGILATEVEKRETYWPQEILPQATLQLEQQIDHYTESLPACHEFILPNGSKCCATLHWARCVCRRAEREICKLEEKSEQENVYFLQILQFANRLSDFLFIASRKVLQIEKLNETHWKSIK